MLAFRWFEVFLLLSNVGRIILTNEGQESFLLLGLSQNDAETILNFQTSLRRILIKSLGEVKEKITEEGYEEAIDEIIQGLQTRAVDPFKIFKDNSSIIQGQLEFPEMADIIHNLQGGRGFTLEDWKSLLEYFSYSARLTSKIQRIPENFQKVYTTDGPFVITVLNAIQKTNLTLTGKLLGDVLRNYCFRDYSPDLGIILENIGEMVEDISLNFSDIRFEKTSSDEILWSILKFISQNHPPSSELVYQIAHVLPKLYKTGNTPLIKDSFELWRLFDLMLPDDYPPDIIQTKNVLSSMVRDNKVGLNLSKLGERFVGHHPREKLLMLIAKLTSLPSVRRKAQAVYPHVKLWQLSLLGKFFHPQTATDVAFLLDSFLTAPIKVNPTFMNEMRNIFFLPDFNWKEVLKDFDYSRYSKPRHVVLNMVQELLNNSSKLPVCCIILLDYFLRSARQISCTTAQREDDVFNGTMNSSVISSDVQGVTRSVMSPLGRFVSTILPLGADSVVSDTTSQSSFTFEMVSTLHTTTPSQNSNFDDASSDLPSSTLFTYSEIPSSVTFSPPSDWALSTVLDNSTEIATTTATIPEHSLPPVNITKVSQQFTEFLSARNTIDKPPLPLSSSTEHFNSEIQLVSSTTESDFSSFLESTSPTVGSQPSDD